MKELTLQHNVLILVYLPVLILVHLSVLILVHHLPGHKRSHLVRSLEQDDGTEARQLLLSAKL